VELEMLEKPDPESIAKILREIDSNSLYEAMIHDRQLALLILRAVNTYFACLGFEETNYR
jgi:hypothetical protein